MREKQACTVASKLEDCSKSHLIALPQAEFHIVTAILSRLLVDDLEDAVRSSLEGHVGLPVQSRSDHFSGVLISTLQHEVELASLVGSPPRMGILP